MDYLYTFVTWEFSIRDLKKLSLNGIKYSSLEESEKTYLKEHVFPGQWKKFVEDLLTNYSRIE